MKKSTISIVLVASAMILLCVASVAYAYGVTLNEKTCPTNVEGGKNYKYGISLDYDTSVYGIPIPSSLQLGIELPYKAFNKPEYVAGSWQTVEFKKVTSAQTGAVSYQAYKTKATVKSVTLTMKSSAKTKKSGWSKASGGYMGVGPNAIGYDWYFTIKKK